MVFAWLHRFALLWLLLSLVLGRQATAQSPGCTDPLATNYNPAATQNNGSCLYADAVAIPSVSVNLPQAVAETSGALLWNNRLWTHNDNTDITLYAFDTATAALAEAVPLSGLTNTDWEDLAQDSTYLYIGDFGNNLSGNRTNLHILRVQKASLLSGTPVTDTIWFSYANQTNFAPAAPNSTNFDCEAFVASADSLYLFTKQWASQSTSLYALPKTPGTFTAQLRGTYPIQGLVTGATYRENDRLLTLCGYSPTLQPFVFLLYDFQGHQFFSGNKRRLNLFLPYHQVEGIATQNGLDYYLTNEYFAQQPLPVTQQKLHRLNLTSYLNAYLNPGQATGTEALHNQLFRVFPNPVREVLHLTSAANLPEATLAISNQLGQVLLRGMVTGPRQDIPVWQLPPGVYLLHLKQANGQQVVKILKQ